MIKETLLKYVEGKHQRHPNSIFRVLNFSVDKKKIRIFVEFRSISSIGNRFHLLHNLVLVLCYEGDGW